MDYLDEHDHRDGVPWYKAPIPNRWHRCRPQTTGQHNGSLVDRCACGAVRYDGRPWINRNDRRKGR